MYIYNSIFNINYTYMYCIYNRERVYRPGSDQSHQSSLAGDSYQYLEPGLKNLHPLSERLESLSIMGTQLRTKNH